LAEKLWHPFYRLPVDWDETRYRRHQRFDGLLDAGAYLEAAMMLVPEGWTYGAWQGPSGQPHKWELRTIGAEDQRYRTVEGKGHTPALALCVAIARATPPTT
jgi:hypothetical protein